MKKFSLIAIFTMAMVMVVGFMSCKNEPAEVTENPISTTYTVKHLQQNINDDNYTEVESDRETKNGNTGDQTAASAKTYEGFTAQEITQKTISASGTVIEIKYNRKIINLTFKSNGEKWSDGTTEDKTVSGKYGATVNAPTLSAKPGYNSSWDKAVQTTFTSAETYTATSTLTEYTIAYSSLPSNLQNPNTATSYTVESDDIAIASIQTDAGIYYWYDEETNGKKVAEIKKGSTGDKTLYAIFVPFTYYDLKTGSAINTLIKTTIDGQGASSFRKSETAPDSPVNYLDSANTSVPVWYDIESTTIYYYIPDGGVLRLNENSRFMFSGLTNITYIETEDFDTSNVMNMGSMFEECKRLSILDVSSWNTSNVTNMGNMFDRCNNLSILDVSNWDTSNVKYMGYMFRQCYMLKSLDVSRWNTGKVESMENMFSNCENLTTVNLSNWDTSNVTNMSFMFFFCTALTSVNMKNIDTSKLENTKAMFSYCEKLSELDLSGWNTSKVTNMNKLFECCYSLTSVDLCGWNTRKVENMSSMFYYCLVLTTIYTDSETDWSSSETLSNSSIMFTRCENLTGGSGTVYDSEHLDKTYARVDGGTDAPGYFTVKSAN